MADNRNEMDPDRAGALHAMSPAEPPAETPARNGRFLSPTWMRAHKIRTALLLVLLVIVAELATIPWFAVPRLSTENPGESAMMRQRRDEAVDAGKTFTLNQRWISLAKIPRPVVDAIIVAEDGTFYSHGGFDWFEVRASVERNVRERRAARGASTITQQLAKNLFLSTSKDPIRKGKEALITLLLEHSLSKDRILEIYLNIIEWGPGVFGIDAASRLYFGKSASALNVEEGARLAAVIPSPLRHRPDADSRYVLRRKEIVLRRMAARASGREIPVPDSGAAADLFEFPVEPLEESPGEAPVDIPAMAPAGFPMKAAADSTAQRPVKSPLDSSEAR